MKRRTVEQQDAVAGLRVYATRMAGDDGWLFVCAKSLNAARKHFNVGDVRAATHAELTLIACRALTGNF
jgi:hypothetical protein